MSFLFGWLKKFGRKKVEEVGDPLGELGISIWSHQWLNKRLQLIEEMTRNLHLRGKIYLPTENAEYIHACSVLHDTLLKAFEPWGRGDPELVRKVSLWLEYYRLVVLDPLERLVSNGKVEEVCWEEKGVVKCRLSGEALEYLNRLAMIVFLDGRSLLQEMWSPKDVEPEKVFMISKPSVSWPPGKPPEYG